MFFGLFMSACLKFEWFGCVNVVEPRTGGPHFVNLRALAGSKKEKNKNRHETLKKMSPGRSFPPVLRILVRFGWYVFRPVGHHV